MIVEYYDIRTGKTEDYGLNINDNTPLLDPGAVAPLQHHRRPRLPRAGLSRRAQGGPLSALAAQRAGAGLVHRDQDARTGGSSAGATSSTTIASPAPPPRSTPSATPRCDTVAHMARVLEQARRERRVRPSTRPSSRRRSTTHLLNPENGLYYLNIDLDGQPRSDVTSDLVFPVMFGVADDETAARIVSRLSSEDFWTEAGIRTVPRDAPTYGPTHGYGLLGGVWVGVTFWYAFAAARFNPDFMAHALATSFRNYSRDPRRNNTVPGQFSEWLHGETLVNQGMMLSPWFPPRYLWAAIEGVAGLDLSGGTPTRHAAPGARLEVAGRAEPALPRRGADLVRRAHAGAAHVLELRLPPVVAVHRLPRGHQRLAAHLGPRGERAGPAPGRRPRAVRRQHRRAHRRDGAAHRRRASAARTRCASSTACAAPGSTKAASRPRRCAAACRCSSSARGSGWPSCGRRLSLTELPRR